MKILLSAAIVCSVAISAFAQKSDGSTKSLVNAEKEFAASAVKNGVKSAFSEYAASDALAFRPNPVNALNYYAAQSDSRNLNWHPVYAKVSRSGDWGFTTGPYEAGAENKNYGQFLSVWKTENGRWKFVLDIGTNSNKPLEKVSNQFIEPKDHYVPKFIDEKAIKAGKEIVISTEKTLNATLKSHGIAAFSGFLNHDARLLFPGNEPIIGKEKILRFYDGMIAKMNLKTTAADKALGGDLAYTYGVATIDYKADLRESFNYVFIYEKQADHTWNLIVQVFTPAER